jgi:hypothetical protein
MPHEHTFWTETSYLKHPRRIQQLQATHCEAKHETSRQRVGTNCTLHYSDFIVQAHARESKLVGFNIVTNVPVCVLINIRQKFLTK